MRNVSVQLKSDFVDFYDSFFDQDGEIFERNLSNEPSRKDMYKILAKHKLIPAVTGKVKKFRKKLPWDAPVIVYTEIERHDGGEKLMMSFKEAFTNYENHEMATYIVNEGNVGVTYRYVRIGDAIFFFKLQGKTWNINEGFEVVESERVSEEDALQMKPFDTPIYSIDFVPAVDSKGKEWMFAVDLNFAPKLEGSGIESLATGEEIAELIRIWYKENK